MEELESELSDLRQRISHRYATTALHQSACPVISPEMTSHSDPGQRTPLRALSTIRIRKVM